jgi:hypothetical protein
MTPPPKLFTLREVARAAAHLSSRACSARRVRYLLIDGRLGTEIGRRAHGQTRLFGSVDVALVHLALRLHREGISPQVARVVLTYLRDDIVRAWKSGAAVGLAVRGVRGSIEPALRARPQHVTAFVPLREVWREAEAELHKVRESRRTVWMWRDVPLDAVPRTTA